MMKKYIILIAAIFFIAGFSFHFMINIPKNYPANTLLTIPKDLSTKEVGLLLKEKHVIKSVSFFQAFIKTFGSDRQIQAGTYFIRDGESVLKIADRMLKGEKNVPYRRVTFPEGSSVTDMAFILLKQDTEFDSQLFIKLALPDEGYLFPDTYLIPIDFTVKKIIAMLKNNFEKRTAEIKDTAKKPFSDIIKMAAVLEEEGNSEESRRMISDILWRRISIGMALQVDVYKPSYKTKGLPPAPISNPGLQSIKAAINPLQNPYLYYISDSDGNFHYAKTYGEHLKNIDVHLRGNK